jgi:hypothetical protein
MWDKWWIKRHWSGSSSGISVFPANSHSTSCSTFINHPVIDTMQSRYWQCCQITNYHHRFPSGADTFYIHHVTFWEPTILTKVRHTPIYTAQWVKRRGSIHWRGWFFRCHHFQIVSWAYPPSCGMGTMGATAQRTIHLHLAYSSYLRLTTVPIKLDCSIKSVYR